MAHREPADRPGELRRAAHLRDAITQRAQERGDSPAQIARVLGISPGHWYRLKKDPLRFSRLTRARLDAVAKYVRWSRVQVLVAVGWLRQCEIDEVILPGAAVQSALERLERSGLANGVTTPIATAAPDHRRLIARLLIAAEAVAASKAAREVE